MNRTPRRIALGAAAALCLGAALVAPAALADPADRPAKTNEGAVQQGSTYDRFLVHFGRGSAAAADDAAARGEVEAVARNAGRSLAVQRRISTGGVLVRVAERLDATQARELIARFTERPAVAFAEVDAVMTATLTPDDPDYAKQWHYSEPLAGMALPTAWDTADGAGVTVAVLDTGITAHSDLAGNVVSGYDFVSDASAARDGDGRDPDPQDEGDWYGFLECGVPSSSNSSWHGTHVAGTVAATTGNATGVSGVAFAAKVQPVRVLAKCGGTLADIADAITWASGGSVSGIPANPTPAEVINMSLGGSGTCGATYQNAINAAVSRGTTVVVAAGNSNADAGNYQPSSCANTVVVAASDREGNRASYSNYGSKVDLTAPGGETATRANGVLSTLNSGTTTPGSESYAYYQGTSMATPHVAGLAALVLGEQAMTPAGLETALKEGTRPLPGSCSGGCGAGLADATKTIAALGGTTPSPEPTASPSPSPEPEPTTEPSPQPSTFSNDTDVAIVDRSTVESPIEVARTGSGSSSLQVPVRIVHSYRGELAVDLVAPDGTVFALKGTSKNDRAADVVQTFVVDASGVPAGGTWRLRVSDRFKGGGSGFLDSWGLQF